LIEDYLGVLRPPTVLQTGEIRFDLPITATNTVVEVSPLLNASNIWKMLVPIPVDNRLVVIDQVTDDARFYRQVNMPPPPLNMALIPAGPFEMGDALGDSVGESGTSRERPVHTVNLSAFYMDKFEVTKRLWDEVTLWASANGIRIETEGGGKAPNHPFYLTWVEAPSWCNARSLREGLEPCYYDDIALTSYCTNKNPKPYVKWIAKGYRLPTEAEWEKAARGGLKSHRFPWNVTTISLTNANYRSGDDPVAAYDLDTYGFHPEYNDGNPPYTAPVGSFSPNGYGLYDTAGNLPEHCWDWWDSSWYSNTIASGDNTHGPAPEGGPPERVFRGGGWSSHASRLRCSSRLGMQAEYFFEIGFRCVRIP
jgi:formylglycine-generating enzyme required for sulfatase activity